MKFAGSSVEWKSYLLFTLAFAVIYLAGFFLRGFIFTRVRSLAHKSRWTLDDKILDILEKYYLPLIIVISIFISLSIVQIPEQGRAFFEKLAEVIFLGTVTFAAARFGGVYVDRISEKTGGRLPSTSLLENVVKGVILVIGFLIITSALGISITPLITALGVGGLAVALALQEPLANLFAGFYINLTGKIRKGDYIKLDSGEEGHVEDITWRYTYVRALGNNLFIIPNTKVSSAIVTNFDLPESNLSVLVQVGVAYDSDLEKVEQVTIEVAREIQKDLPGAVDDFEPFIRYHTFGDFSINFTVILRAKTFVDTFLIKHEFIKRLHKRYEKEGIVIPFPIRTVQFDSDLNIVKKGK
ncbi:MAG: mechanosensitive ion channel family protein [Deltaproteobacteria bacterium]|nr:MAG: mechanosensitive ion channel family protein [Deltaproteobacteria bacterium]